MTTEAELLHAHTRGERAKAVLENELVQEAFDAVDRKLFEEWKDSPPRDREGRERLFDAYKAKEQFKSFFTMLIQDGDAAAAILRKREHDSMLDRFRR